MECNSSKEEEFVVDIKNFESTDEPQSSELCNKWVKSSIPVIASSKNANPDNALRELGRPEDGEDKQPLTQKERRMGGKAQKPPRPPKGPSLDAADMRFVKEISRIALKKKARIQRLNELKKLSKASKPATPSSLFSPTSGSWLSAMVVTVVFFLILIFQGLSGSSSGFVFMGAPQTAPGKAFSPVSSSQRSS